MPNLCIDLLSTLIYEISTQPFFQVLRPGQIIHTVSLYLMDKGRAALAGLALDTDVVIGLTTAPALARVAAVDSFLPEKPLREL